MLCVAPHKDPRQNRRSWLHQPSQTAHRCELSQASVFRVTAKDWPDDSDEDMHWSAVIAQTQMASDTQSLRWLWI
jgi:hypothetical protein